MMPVAENSKNLDPNIVVVIVPAVLVFVDCVLGNWLLSKENISDVEPAQLCPDVIRIIIVATTPPGT